MRGFNKVILAGNLTRDPELRYTPAGLAIAKFGLAVNRSWKDDQGNQKEEVTFVEIESFGKQAETVGQYFKKGKPILIEGRLKFDQWDDKQTGQKRSALRVVLESFTFLGEGQAREAGGGGGESYAPAPAAAARPRPAQAQAPAPADPEAMPPDEDDVPF